MDMTDALLVVADVDPRYGSGCRVGDVGDALHVKIDLRLWGKGGGVQLCTFTSKVISKGWWWGGRNDKSCVRSHVRFSLLSVTRRWSQSNASFG